MGFGLAKAGKVGSIVEAQRGAHGKEAFGSLMVDCHDFDMIPYIPYPRDLAEVESSKA